MKPLLVATGNAHKLDELRQLLPGIPLVGLADFPPAPEVVEDAPDFAGNALLKAQAAHARTGHLTLADDSGIEVAHLDWAPGIHSARYVPGSDDDRLHALLAACEDATDRRARFRCVVALVGLGDAPFFGEGVVEGVLTRAPRGTHGFGYDPIFELPDGRAMAELGDEKHAISHRGRAAREIIELLKELP